VVLPDNLFQRSRPHPDRQGCRRGQPRFGAVLRLHSEQPVGEKGPVICRTVIWHTAKVPPWADQ
jgi:hypothetical protein